MKKQILILALSSIALSASALEVGVLASHENVGARNGAGVVVSQKLGSFSVSGEAERFTKGLDNQNRYSVLGKYEVVKLGNIGLNVGGGVAYLDSTTSSNGYTGVGSVGATFAVTDKVSLTADFRKQYSRGVTSQYNGNNAVVSVRYSF